MKTTTIVLFILSMFILSFRMLKENNMQTTASQLSHPDSLFIIGALESGADWSFTRLTDSLGTNLWHRYPDGYAGWITSHHNWVRYDSLNADYSIYGQRVKQVIEGNRDSGMYTLMNRGKIQHLCFGQRSDYQCEKQSMADPDYWFYTYANRDSQTQDSNKTGRDTVDGSQFGNDVKVVQCISGTDQPGYVVKGLKANREQINCIESWGAKANDEGYKWFIKPRIRIDSAFANTQSNLQKTICQIRILDFDANTVKTVYLRARHFLNLQNHYAGQYIEEFNYNSGDTQLVVDPENDELFNPNCEYLWNEDCRVDFRVYWYGLCDMWIDYVRVDNDVANDLFRNVFIDTTQNRPWLIWESKDIASQYPNAVFRFYIEEFEFNQIPCMTYVSRRIDSLWKINNPSGSMSLMCDLNYSTFKIHVPGFDTVRMSAERIKRTLVDRIGSREIFMGAYPFLSHGLEGGGLPSYIPNTLPNSAYHEPDLTGHSVSVTQYEDWLQEHLDEDRNEWFDVTLYNKTAYEVSKLADIPFINLIQTHSWFAQGHHLREPLNEEISLLSYLGISYGAKGHLFFEMTSTDSGQYFDHFSRGLGEADPVAGTYSGPRYLNAYGQEKWTYVCNLNENIAAISKFLLSFDSDSTDSYSHRTERNELLSNTCFNDLITYKPGNGTSPCDNSNNPSGTLAECIDDRYLQVAKFNNSEPSTQYFMIINRRCAPFFDTATDNSNGGRRFVQIKLDSNSSSFAGFNNWNIYDLSNDSIVSTFNKRLLSLVNLGWFLPGEGKLYKLAPVMQEGGTLVADENCGGFEFECRGEVNNDGNDITIVPNTTILFSNTNARIVMNGGSFHSGSSSESYPIYLNAKSGSTWRGLNLGNCEEVELHQTHFNGVSPYPVDSTYAAEFTDCGSINISNCVFSASSTGKTGSLLITYTSQVDPAGVYIFSNTFNLNTGTMPAVSVIATGYDEVPLLMELNGFESCSENSTLAILLSNVTGGAIKESNFTGYDKTVFMLGSSIDFYGNYIIGSDQSSVGIIQHSASNANLSASGEMFTGGYNSITAEGQTAKCIQLSNSYLLIDEGYNVFRLEDSQTNNYHLEGTIPNDVGADPYPAENNCFQLGNGLLVKHNLRWIDETAINLDTIPSSCNSERPESFMVFNLGNGINDTVRYETGGSGGGESNFKLQVASYKMEEAGEAGSVYEAVTIKALSDSVSINLRKHDYERVSILCKQMLTDYADSINDASIISKLYLAELKKDTNQIRMSELKSFLESYILNNPEKEMIIRQAFYFIQKCKVSLGLYESAMTGFQQIINQFPSYEGLLASWDYAATSLLNSQGGSGGGASSKNEPALRYEG